MEVTDDNFEEKVIEQSKDKIIVVDFWAPWCGPCNMLAPIIEKVVESYKDKVVLAKLNIDENPAKSNEYGVNAIPAIKIFKDGKIVEQFEGVQPEDAIKAKINAVLE